MRRHLISLNDLSYADLCQIIQRSTDFSKGNVEIQQLLVGQIIGIYFKKTSTRTRTAFSAAALRMGAQIISYGPNDLQINTGETIEDTTNVLSGMLDCLVARTAGEWSEMQMFASQNKMSVINAMSADEHPTQALADLTTIKNHFGKIENIKVLYFGEGNNTAAALALALTKFPGAELHLRTPQGYGLKPEILQAAQQYAQISSAKIIENHDPFDLPNDIDVIYTTRWETTGTSKEDPCWKERFQPFMVTSRLMDSYSSAVFMHDLPAHRGEEVEADVLDGPASIAFVQAKNKMYSAMAAMEWCLSSSSN